MFLKGKTDTTVVIQPNVIPPKKPYFVCECGEKFFVFSGLGAAIVTIANSENFGDNKDWFVWSCYYCGRRYKKLASDPIEVK